MQACFGKHDSDYLLLCDNCDVEYHTYCLDPPLSEIPLGSWFCIHCKESGYGVDTTISPDADSAITGGSGASGVGEDAVKETSEEGQSNRKQLGHNTIAHVDTDVTISSEHDR